MGITVNSFGNTDKLKSLAQQTSRTYVNSTAEKLVK